MTVSKAQQKREARKRRELEGFGKTRYPGKGLDPVRYASPELRKQVIERDWGHCRYCQEEVVYGNVDHVFAHSRGGATVITNLVWACHECNQAKNWRHNMRPTTLRKHRSRITAYRNGQPKRNKPKPTSPAGPKRKLKIDDHPWMPDQFKALVGTECEHRMSPHCQRLTCLRDRWAETQGEPNDQ